MGILAVLRQLDLTPLILFWCSSSALPGTKFEEDFAAVPVSECLGHVESPQTHAPALSTFIIIMHALTSSQQQLAIAAVIRVVMSSRT